jgi:hypothetical protein
MTHGEAATAHDLKIIKGVGLGVELQCMNACDGAHQKTKK